MRPSLIADAVRGHGGVVLGRRLPVSRQALALAVDAGTLVRLRPGVFAVPECAQDEREAATHGGEVACVSALERRGIWVLTDHRIHVWVGAHGRAHPHAGCRCRTHRDEGVSGFGVVSVVHALAEVARCRGSEAFFASFESAWRLGLLTASDRAEVRARLSARHRWLVDFARPDADSGLESVVRLRAARLGIHLESQVWIEGVGRVDFLLDGRVILEVDGRENHEAPEKRHKDLIRDAAATVRGYRTLRVDYAMVMHQWHLVEAAILASVIRA